VIEVVGTDEFEAWYMSLDEADTGPRSESLLSAWISTG